MTVSCRRAVYAAVSLADSCGPRVVGYACRVHRILDREREGAREWARTPRRNALIQFAALYLQLYSLIIMWFALRRNVAAAVAWKMRRATDETTGMILGMRDGDISKLTRDCVLITAAELNRRLHGTKILPFRTRNTLYVLKRENLLEKTKFRALSFIWRKI